jgi:hypothetical protein
VIPREIRQLLGYRSAREGAAIILALLLVYAAFAAGDFWIWRQAHPQAPTWTFFFTD